ncbi:MAG: DNA cytosine methyltransferase [Phenylobacterium sp.]|uniref:DNA cytosine methyltransferase n=1 Tax=Phenylobacterium sp. TaxID=1871053 RepID=UPI003BB51295
MADGSWPLHPSAGRPIYAGAPGKLKVIGFAGGGGSSEAMRQALNCDPDLAMNHWQVAVLAHMRHFPFTEHACADVWQVDPRYWRPGERIGFGWFSPDCTDFSKAKGGAPRSERIRGLAWSVIPWAAFRMIDTILLENVEEFLKWGPVYREGALLPDGTPAKVGEPIPERRGETFARFVRRLRHLGYVVDWRILNAADYGAPTTRKRFYLVAKYVGVINQGWIDAGLAPSPIVWPAPTHAPRRKAKKLGLLPYRALHECIDWSETCPSIFLDRKTAKALGFVVKRPLVPATLNRVARGLEKFVIGSAEPFIVPLTHQGDSRVYDSRDPMRTATTAHRGEFAAVDVAMISNSYGSNTRGGRGDPREPGKTQVGAHHSAVVTGALVGVGGRRGQSPPTQLQAPGPTFTGKADAALVTGYMVPRYGERDGQAPRVRDVRDEGATIVPDQNGGSLAIASLQQLNTRDVGQHVADPARTATETGNQAVQVAYLGRQFGSTVSGRDMADPAPVIMTDGGGGKLQAVTATAAHVGTYYGQGIGSDAGEPGRSATGKDRHALTLAHLAQANAGKVGHDMAKPASTILQSGSHQQLIETALALEGGSTGRRAEVLAFLWAHFGEPTPEEWANPAATLQGRLRFGLVILGGLVWMIVDIGLRMLKPSELALAMGLPPTFDLTVDTNGDPISKTNQIRMIGNMVSPPPARALIAANCPDLIDPPQLQEAA